MIDEANSALSRVGIAEANRFRILVAEDSPGDITLVREALKEAGVHCDMNIISDGAQVIGYLRGLDSSPHSPAPHLVLLDMHLPKVDCEHILKALRSTERSAQTPVVVMTSSTASEFEKIAQRHATLHYFHKPSSWSEFSQLGAIVKEILLRLKASGSETLPASNNRGGAA